MKSKNPLKKILYSAERFFRAVGKKALYSRKRQKTYRFAVYGRAASGKTCILAALAMKCIAHPSRLTSTWILEPAGIERPKGEPETWDIRNPASAYHLGKIWLENAIERLIRGELPPPNPNRAEPLRYLYHFTTPDHHTYPVELIDYSGELIDPSITNDEMAQRLREHLSTMDGILVLAEVPHPKGKKNQPLTHELHKLEQAFAILKNESYKGPTLDIPLALLINKWDRRSRLRYTTPENEYKDLLGFLESKPEPPHKSLVDALRYSVTPENFKVFPVSAFGEYELAQTADNKIIERPKHVAPMRPFGLEDGFVWAAQRRDFIDMELFEDEVSKKSSWCFLKNATFFPSLPLLIQGRRLRSRFPRKTPERTRVNRALKQFSLTLLTNFLCFSVILFSFFLVGEVIYDSFKFRSVIATKNDPESNTGQLQVDEEWLVKFYRAPFYRHAISHILVLNRDEAMATLKNFRQRREEKLWSPVEQATDDLIRVELAKKYLHQFGENGKYRDLANSIVTQAEQSQKYLENQIHINNIATSFQTMLLKGNQDEVELERLYDQLDNIPFPQALTQELYGQQKELLERIANEKISLAKNLGKEKWLDMREKYISAMREGDVSKALRFLSQLQSQTVERNQTEKLLADYKKRVIQVLQKNIDEKTRKNLWRQARDIAQQAQEDKNLVSMLTAKQLREIRKISENIDIAEDKYLYNLVVKYKDPDHVSQYLKYAPLKKMGSTVTRYSQYLNRQANPLNLQLQIESITWGGGCGDSDLLVTYNGKTIIEKTGFAPPKKGRSAKVGSTNFRAKLSDIANIYAKVTCESWWRGENTGKASWKGTVGNLLGLRLNLEREGSEKSSITFTLSGLPDEPLLPPWGS